MWVNRNTSLSAVKLCQLGEGQRFITRPESAVGCQPSCVVGGTTSLASPAAGYFLSQWLATWVGSISSPTPPHTAYFVTCMCPHIHYSKQLSFNNIITY